MIVHVHVIFLFTFQTALIYFMTDILQRAHAYQERKVAVRFCSTCIIIVILYQTVIKYAFLGEIGLRRAGAFARYW